MVRRSVVARRVVVVVAVACVCVVPVFGAAAAAVPVLGAAAVAVPVLGAAAAAVPVLFRRAGQRMVVPREVQRHPDEVQRKREADDRRDDRLPPPSP